MPLDAHLICHILSFQYPLLHVIIARGLDEKSYIVKLSISLFFLTSSFVQNETILANPRFRNIVTDLAVLAGDFGVLR